MTKEELKEEAIKYAVDYSTSYGKGYKHKDLRIAYLAGAEPREKRIEELELKIKHLTNHLEPQAMTALFELVEEEVKQEQRNKELEWHDLEKNPNDLPENKRNVWCDYGDGYGKGCYNKDDGGWWIEGHMFCSIIDAWCELPTRNKGDKTK